jgi:hypothetical protein
MAWQRQMDAGVLRTALRGAQQLAGGPEITVPVDRNGAQLLTSYNVWTQFVGLSYGGGGGGPAAVAWSAAIATTAMASKETTVGAAMAAAAAWWWSSTYGLVYETDAATYGVGELWFFIYI